MPSPDLPPNPEVTLNNLLSIVMERVAISWGDLIRPETFQHLPNPDQTAQHLRELYDKLAPGVHKRRMAVMLQLAQADGDFGIPPTAFEHRQDQEETP